MKPIGFTVFCILLATTCIWFTLPVFGEEFLDVDIKVSGQNRVGVKVSAVANMAPNDTMDVLTRVMVPYEKKTKGCVYRVSLNTPGVSSFSQVPKSTNCSVDVDMTCMTGIFEGADLQLFTSVKNVRSQSFLSSVDFENLPGKSKSGNCPEISSLDIKLDLYLRKISKFKLVLSR